MDNAISEGMQSLLLAAVLEDNHINPFVYHVVDKHVLLFYNLYIVPFIYLPMRDGARPALVILYLKQDSSCMASLL